MNCAICGSEVGTAGCPTLWKHPGVPMYVHGATPVGGDPRDAEIATLRAEVERLKGEREDVLARVVNGTTGLLDPGPDPVGALLAAFLATAEKLKAAELAASQAKAHAAGADMLREATRKAHANVMAERDEARASLARVEAERDGAQAAYRVAARTTLEHEAEVAKLRAEAGEAEARGFAAGVEAAAVEGKRWAILHDHLEWESDALANHIRALRPSPATSPAPKEEAPAVTARVLPRNPVSKSVLHTPMTAALTLQEDRQREASAKFAEMLERSRSPASDAATGGACEACGGTGWRYGPVTGYRIQCEDCRGTGRSPSTGGDNRSPSSEGSGK